MLGFLQMDWTSIFLKRLIGYTCKITRITQCSRRVRQGKRELQHILENCNEDGILDRER